jgi:Common central domain of tyrosinase
LPYWDYTDPKQVALPLQFRSKDSKLYDSRRDPDMNPGASTLNPDTTNMDGPLLHQTDFFSYEGQIERGIHGYVHCIVGPTCPVAYMGDVPVAGKDSIFYSHHANIDRLWACWQHLHTTPPGAWQDQQFSFVDETDTMQTQPVKNFLGFSSPNHVGYDNVTNCTRSTSIAVASNALTPQVAPAGGVKKKTALGITKAIIIDQPQTTVDINVPKTYAARILCAVSRRGNGRTRTT